MIVLYRDGDTHEINGVKCEMGRFKNSALKAMLSAGWRVTPEAEESNVVDISPDIIRAKARDAGIEGWETKRIKTLQKALGDNSGSSES